MTQSATPGQTVGPFFGTALPFDGGAELVPPGRPGTIRLHGHVLDGSGDPVPDALVEVWQADGRGSVSRSDRSLHRDGHTFTGWGRCATDANGRYSFSTVEPGPVEGSAPFWAVAVFARGLLDRQFTRAYLPGPLASTDRFLARLAAGRRTTLMAVVDEGGYRFDIHLQGPQETVFLDFGRRVGG